MKHKKKLTKYIPLTEMAYERKALVEFLHRQSDSIIRHILKMSLYPGDRSASTDWPKTIFDILRLIQKKDLKGGKLTFKFYFNELGRDYNNFDDLRHFRKVIASDIHDITTYEIKDNSKFTVESADYESLMGLYGNIFKKFSELLSKPEPIDREEINRILETLK